MHVIKDIPDDEKALSDEVEIILNQIDGNRGFAKLSREKQDAYLSEPGEFAEHEIERVRMKLMESNLLQMKPVDATETGTPETHQDKAA